MQMMAKLVLGKHCGQSLTQLNNHQAQLLFLYVNLLVILICVGIEILFAGKFRTVPPPVGVQGPRQLVMECKGRRLGNLMFSYAALLGIAQTNNMVPVFPDGLIIRDMFNLTMKVGYFDYNFGMYLDYREFGGRGGAYDRMTENLEAYDTNIRLLGHYQSWKYFEHVKDVAREHFRFKPDILSNAKDYLHNLIPQKFSGNNFIRVGIHVRRGDMTVPYYTNYGYVTADARYIYQAVDYFQKRFSRVIFVVCSDDIQWCKENINLENVVFSESGDMVTDMAVLASCQHTIMTVGSFGWWSAWLANGTTIYYKDWPRPVSQLEYQVEKADYFPPHWIPM